MSNKLSIDAVCRLIDALLPRGYPLIEEVASLLCVSPRTLQRLLQEEGVSYSEMIDRCRCRTACQSLEHTHIPIHDIAASLGYRDASSFTRAFRRWTGTAPRTYRNRSLGVPNNTEKNAGMVRKSSS